MLPDIPLSRPAWDGPGAKPFEWAEPHIGHRSKLGGSPDFEHSVEWPKCSCGEEMAFYGQLDSISDDYMIADVGMIYVFLCFGCFET